MMIIKNGHVIDPLNNVDGIMDIAVEGKTILQIGNDLPAKETDNLIDAKGCYVVPGLIDHHAHVQPLAKIGLPSEASCFSSGVTTVVDAGSTGCANYIYHQGILERLRLNVRACMDTDRAAPAKLGLSGDQQRPRRDEIALFYVRAAPVNGHLLDHDGRLHAKQYATDALRLVRQFGHHDRHARSPSAWQREAQQKPLQMHVCKRTHICFFLSC